MNRTLCKPLLLHRHLLTKKVLLYTYTKHKWAPCLKSRLPDELDHTNPLKVPPILHLSSKCVRHWPLIKSRQLSVLFVGFEFSVALFPVSDHLQYAKTEGKGLVHFIVWKMSMSAYVDKGVGGVPNRTNIAYVLFVLTNQQQVFLLKKLKLGQTLQKKGTQAHSFNRRLLLPPVYLGT